LSAPQSRFPFVVSSGDDDCFASSLRNDVTRLFVLLRVEMRVCIDWLKNFCGIEFLHFQRMTTIHNWYYPNDADDKELAKLLDTIVDAEQ
jgi:hypothetical protein